MNRYEVDTIADNGGIVYRIFDNYQQKYLDGQHTDIESVIDDCDIMNEYEEIENGREFV